MEFLHAFVRPVFALYGADEAELHAFLRIFSRYLAMQALVIMPVTKTMEKAARCSRGELLLNMMSPDSGGLPRWVCLMAGDSLAVCRDRSCRIDFLGDVQNLVNV